MCRWAFVQAASSGFLLWGTMCCFMAYLVVCYYPNLSNILPLAWLHSGGDRRRLLHCCGWAHSQRQGRQYLGENWHLLDACTHSLAVRKGAYRVELWLCSCHPVCRQRSCKLLSLFYYYASEIRVTVKTCWYCLLDLRTCHFVCFKEGEEPCHWQAHRDAHRLTQRPGSQWFCRHQDATLLPIWVHGLDGRSVSHALPVFALPLCLLADDL